MILLVFDPMFNWTTKWACFTLALMNVFVQGQYKIIHYSFAYKYSLILTILSLFGEAMEWASGNMSLSTSYVSLLPIERGGD